MSATPLSSNPSERRVPRTRALEQILLGALPLALTVWLAVASVSQHWVAEDFSMAYYPAAHRLLAGGNPYAVTHAQVLSGAAFVYPALSAVLLAPLALVSSGLADHIYTLLCIGLVPATLWVSGVRDWRVYGVSLLWFPIIIGWEGENISVPLMFLAALVWRHRDRPWVAGALSAMAISMKPFVWPLALWLVATRRFKAAAWTLAAGLVFNLLAWYLVGFNEISTYIHMSTQDADALWRGGYGVLALAHHLGLGRGAGDLLLILSAALLCAVILYLGLIRRDQRGAFVVAVALMLVASPLVWIHYFVLLAVPLALSRPRFALLWAVPIAMWLLPSGPTVAGWQLALAWALAAGTLIAALSPPRSEPWAVPRPAVVTA
jgi:alpha-1,2-mannosyltransferase